MVPRRCVYTHTKLAKRLAWHDISFSVFNKTSIVPYSIFIFRLSSAFIPVHVLLISSFSCFHWTRRHDRMLYIPDPLCLRTAHERMNLL